MSERQPTAYPDGKCNDECGGGHPVLEAEKTRSLVQDTTHSTKEIHMSDKTPATGPILAEASEESVVATKRNFVQRWVVDPIKTHPKMAIAIAAGAGLVGAAALAGRKSAQYDVVLELQPNENEDLETVTVIDTTVA